MSEVLKNRVRDIERIREFVSLGEFEKIESGIAAGNIITVPSFADVHVHFREPGFFYKETIMTGTKAAAHGGYATVMTMPNLNPVPDSVEHLDMEIDLIDEFAEINVIPYGAITIGEKGKEIADLEGMAPDVCAFSDDGVGLNDPELMKEAMMRAKALGKLIVAHCEDMDLRAGGYIHDGEYAKIHGHKGICYESEWKPIERDLKLAEETSAGYHVCHISARESVEVIREAKARGVDATCETAPHYLVLNDMDLQEDGRFKMNPPIRSEEDRQALIEGIKDGTIDVIATDHAPHAAEEKAKGLKESAMGIVGLETAFPVLYTELVMKDVISLDKLIELMAVNPRNRFGLEPAECTKDFAVWELDTEYEIDPETFLTKGRATPFRGRRVYGRCVLNVVNDRIVWKDEIK